MKASTKQCENRYLLNMWKFCLYDTLKRNRRIKSGNLGVNKPIKSLCNLNKQKCINHHSILSKYFPSGERQKQSWRHKAMGENLWDAPLRIEMARSFIRAWSRLKLISESAAHLVRAKPEDEEALSEGSASAEICSLSRTSAYQETCWEALELSQISHTTRDKKQIRQRKLSNQGTNKSSYKQLFCKSTEAKKKSLLTTLH